MSVYINAHISTPPFPFIIETKQSPLLNGFEFAQ